MARSFAAASSQCLTSATSPVSTTPCTLACWFKKASDQASQAVYLMSLGRTANDDAELALRINNASPYAVTATARASDTNSSAATSSGTGTGTWYHGAAVFASSSSRTAYLNASGVNNTTPRDATLLDTLAIASWSRVATPGAMFDGDIAHAAIWSVALTAADIASLYNNGIGLDPRSVRPDALVAYWPLLDNDGDRDWWGVNHLTATNSPTYAQHPPVLMKSRPTVVVMAGSSAPTISSVTISGTRQIGQTITATVATSPTPVDSIAYQWQKAATDDATPGTDLTGETSQTLALSYEDFGDLLDSDANSVYVRCQAIATNGGQDSAEVASDWLSVSLPAGGGVAGSPLKSPFLIS